MATQHGPHNHATQLHSLADERKSEEVRTGRCVKVVNRVFNYYSGVKLAEKSSSNLPSAELHEIQTLHSFL